jgi:hypothetical protein
MLERRKRYSCPEFLNRKRERLPFPFVIIDVSIPLALLMKTLTKNPLPEGLQNPINRDLIVIFFSAIGIAVFLVCAVIVAYHQW